MSATYQRVDNVRLRAFDKWHAAMAYTPDEPALHWLNSSAWLVLELCNGRAEEEIVEEYGQLFSGRDGHAQTVRACLESLEQKGIITITEGTSTTGGKHGTQ
jgi:Coenzyme PQQ synthesis protein D (PqqD)